MAELVERLMNLAPDGVSPAPDKTVDPVHSQITTHEWYSVNVEVLYGPRTVAEVKTFWQMNTAQQAEYDAIVALAPTGTTTVARLGRLEYIHRVHAVFMLGRGLKPPGYSTPAEIRARLGI